MNAIVGKAVKSAFDVIGVWLFNKLDPLWDKKVSDLQNTCDDAEKETNERIVEYKKLVAKICAAKERDDLNEMKELVASISTHIRVRLFTCMQKQWLAFIMLTRKRDGKSKPVNLLHDIYESVSVIIDAYVSLQELCDNYMLDIKIEMPTSRCMDNVCDTFRYYFPVSRKKKWLNPILVKFDVLHRNFH